MKYPLPFKYSSPLLNLNERILTNSAPLIRHTRYVTDKLPSVYIGIRINPETRCIECMSYFFWVEEAAQQLVERPLND